MLHCGVSETLEVCHGPPDRCCFGTFWSFLTKFDNRCTRTFQHWTMAVRSCGTSTSKLTYSRAQLICFANNLPARINKQTWTTFCQLGLSTRGPTRRGSRRGCHKQRQIAVIATTRGLHPASSSEGSLKCPKEAWDLPDRLPNSQQRVDVQISDLVAVPIVKWNLSRRYLR